MFDISSSSPWMCIRDVGILYIKSYKDHKKNESTFRTKNIYVTFDFLSVEIISKRTCIDPIVKAISCSLLAFLMP